uniref:Thioesterase domain-containing protein n=1 Tax=Chenopodium quinoa TaxID=63459 RepID=A0A803KUZ2_CHEQI
MLPALTTCTAVNVPLTPPKAARLQNLRSIPPRFPSISQPLEFNCRRHNQRAIPLACATNAPAIDVGNGKGAVEFFEIEMKVRDYELDQFGVVNNARYANYIEHARHELLESIGLSASAVAHSGDSLALSELTLKFTAPLRFGTFELTSNNLDGPYSYLNLLFQNIAYASGKFHVAATRVLQEDFTSSRNDHVSMYPLHERVKYQMAYLLERLSSAPSGGGGGH